MDSVEEKVESPPETAEPASEAQLLTGLRQGQARAYEALMRRYNRSLFRAARGIAGSDAEAQDAVQEGYLSAFLALPSFRGEASLRTWLTRIVVHQALSQQRKRGRLVFRDDIPAHEEDDMPQRDDTPTGEDPATPEQALMRQQVQAQLQAAVDQLAPIYRSVFILRAVEGLSVEETAQALGVSTEVVKTRHLRARAQLRGVLGRGAAEPARLYDFLGQRCDDTVAAVMARLRAIGLVRDH